MMRRRRWRGRDGSGSFLLGPSSASTKPLAVPRHSVAHSVGLPVNLLLGCSFPDSRARVVTWPTSSATMVFPEYHT
eukprot:7594714-Pyramimonas_sp.AAC.1